MIVVTKENFEEKYSQIIDDLKSSSFISIDCEFSGLFTKNCSLFDSLDTKFAKLQANSEGFKALQVGISTFQYDKFTNTFNSSSYSFQLMPSLFQNEDLSMKFNVESIKFLCKHSFDFNRVFQNGISFLNEKYEAEITKKINNNSLDYSQYTEYIQKFCSLVSKWNARAEINSEISLDVSKDPDLIYLLHLEIREKFRNLWTYHDINNVIVIKKVTPLEKQKLLNDKNEDILIKKKLMNSILGFSRILKEIKNLKKPVVGHNFLLDLLIIYKQFFNPAPVTYKKFKKEIIKIFPILYDTKCLSYNLKNILPKSNTYNSNSLKDLYSYLKTGKGATEAIYAPQIKCKDEKFEETENFHEGAFDSFCTGLCFVKMAHLFSSWDEDKKKISCSMLPHSMNRFLRAVESMKNRINIARAPIDYICLDGEDPKKGRIGFLYIQSKLNKPIDLAKVLEQTAKYTFAEIALMNKFRGLMALANQRETGAILEHFKSSKELRVTRYSFIKHSYLGRTLTAGGLIASTVLLCILFQSFRSTKMMLKYF